MRLFTKTQAATLGQVVLLALATSSAGAVSAHAQNPIDAQMRKMLHPPSHASGTTYVTHGPVPDATTPPSTGTIEVTFTITLKTPVASGNSIYCTTEVGGNSINDLTGAFVTYREQAWSLAKVTGSTATCTVNTPYSWAFPAASTTIQNGYAGSYNVTMESGAAQVTQSERGSGGDFVFEAKVPAAGTVTKYSVAVTL